MIKHLKFKIGEKPKNTGIPVVFIYHDELVMYQDSETVYKFMKMWTKQLQKMKRSDKLPGEIK